MLKKEQAPSGCSRCEAPKHDGTSCKKFSRPSPSSQSKNRYLHPMTRRGLDNLRFDLIEIPEAQRTATEESAVKAIEFLMRNF